MNNRWQLQDAKSKFSQLVESAMEHKPQIVTKHGKKAVVIVDYNDYQKMQKPTSDLINFFSNSPLASVDLDLSRSKEHPRDIDL